MKKVILFAAILFAGVSVVKAEGPKEKSDNTTLQVNLKGVQSIVVNDKNVVLNYTDDTDYSGGVNVEKEDHLTVFSTSDKFSVFVQSENGFSNTTTTSAVTPFESSLITIKATEGASKALTDAAYTADGVKLSSVLQEIFKSTKRADHNTVNVEYKGSGNYDFINYLNTDGTDVTYEATVTYTITAG